MHVAFSKNVIEQRRIFIGNECLKTVQKAKILGVIVQSDLKWDSHISDLSCRCNKKLYMLRCLKTYRLPLCDLITVYKGYIRPILDYGVPVYNGNLTQSQILCLERIQKRACRIMLGDHYTDYASALEMCTLQSLSERRKQLCINFAVSLANSPFCNHWLPANNDVNYSLRSRAKYRQFHCKTKRYKNSPIPYLIDLLNADCLLQ